MLLVVDVDQAKVGESCILCYDSKSFCLLDRAGKLIANLSNRDAIADIEYPSFFRSQRYLELPFDTGAVQCIAMPEHTRHLRLFVEHNVIRTSPHLLRQKRNHALRLVWLGLFGGLIAFAVCLVIPLKVVAAVGATGIALAIRGVLELVHYRRMTRDLSFDDSTEVDQAARFLPEKSDISHQIDRLVEWHNSCQRRNTQLTLSSALDLISVAVSLFCSLYVADLMSPARQRQKPFAVAVPIKRDLPIAPFELPANWDKAAVLEPQSEFVDVQFPQQALLNGWWKSQDARLTFGELNLRGRSLEKPSFNEWHADMLANPFTEVRRLQPVKPIVRFDRPRTGWPLTPALVESEASMTCVTADTERVRLVLEGRRLTQKIDLWVLDSQRFQELSRYKARFDDHAKWVTEATEFNTQAAAFNQEVAQREQHADQLRKRVAVCALIIGLIAAISLLIPVVLLRPFRFSFNLCLCAFAMFVQWMALPDEPHTPIAPIAIQEAQ